MIYPLIVIFICVLIIIFLVYKRNVINPVRREIDKKIDDFIDDSDSDKNEIQWVDQLIENL